MKKNTLDEVAMWWLNFTMLAVLCSLRAVLHAFQDEVEMAYEWLLPASASTLVVLACEKKRYLSTSVPLQVAS